VAGLSRRLASINGEATRRGGALDGDCAGEGWASGTKLTGGPWLPARGVRERGRGGEALTGGARVSVGGSGARTGLPGPGREGGDAGARELGWKSAQPREGESFPFSFLILILFLFLFYFCVFLFLVPLQQKFSK
jgi:hypothetical protein